MKAVFTFPISAEEFETILEERTLSRRVAVEQLSRMNHPTLQGAHKNAYSETQMRLWKMKMTNLAVSYALHPVERLRVRVGEWIEYELQDRRDAHELEEEFKEFSLLEEYEEMKTALGQGDTQRAFVILKNIGEQRLKPVPDDLDVTNDEWRDVAYFKGM